MLLVHHDQAEFGEGQEQGGSGADNHARLPVGHRAPGGAPGARGEVGVPERRRHAEAALEAAEELRGEGDFGQQNEGLAALLQTGGHGFEIGLGLAGAGDPVEQGYGESGGGDRGAKFSSHLLLRHGEFGAGMAWVWRAKGWWERDGRGEKKAGLCHGTDDGRADAGEAGELGAGAGDVVGQDFEHTGARFREAGFVRLGVGGGVAGGGHGGSEGVDPERHGEHVAGGGQGVGSHPVDEAAQRRG